MSTIQKIEYSLYEYYKKNITEPSGILIHPNTFDDLVDELREGYDIPTDMNRNDAKYRGIKIFESLQLNKNEIKIIL